jgi:hypothetical protein
MTTHSHRPLRSLAAAAMIAAATSTGCGEFFTEPAPAATAGLAVSFSLLDGTVLADPAALAVAYDKADRVRITVFGGDMVLAETVVPLAPAAENRVRVDLATQQDTTRVYILVEVLRDNDALFFGEAAAIFVANAVSTVVVNLSPVAAGVRILTRPVPVLGYADTIRLAATALFATGDPLPGAEFNWSSSNPSIIGIDQTGLVGAWGDGSAIITAGYLQFTDTVTVRAQRAVGMSPGAPLNRQ